MFFFSDFSPIFLLVFSLIFFLTVLSDNLYIVVLGIVFSVLFWIYELFCVSSLSFFIVLLGIIYISSIMLFFSYGIILSSIINVNVFSFSFSYVPLFVVLFMLYYYNSSLWDSLEGYLFYCDFFSSSFLFFSFICFFILGVLLVCVYISVEKYF